MTLTFQDFIQPPPLQTLYTTLNDCFMTETALPNTRIRPS